MKLKIVAFLTLAIHFAGYSQDKKLFLNPPDVNRPWIFWDWMDDLVTKKGITSDLEQFKKFGVRGTLIMLVGRETGNYPMWDKSNIPHPVISQTPEFFDMWKFAAEESGRLGLTITTQCGPGWCHSGGPWVKPDQAVQHIASTETETINGPLKNVEIIAGNNNTSKEARTYVLAKPGAELFTADIGIVAYPDKPIVQPKEIIDLTPLLKNGRVAWNIPAGKWKIKRYAMINALAYNRPAPIGGKGLECDKLDKDAVDAMFAGMVGRYIKDSPQLVGKTIKAFEADSWEVGNPEWSAKFKAEFIKRRGYDPTPWLITFKRKQIVGDQDLTTRFQNDMYLTQTDLFAENFFTHLANKADSAGMNFMTEPYMGPFDPIRMGGRVQVPMCEFWASGDFMNSLRWASSSAHTYGHPVVASEAFTGRWNDGNWTMDPYALKRVGDLAFCNGTNHYILHGTAMQPWGTDVKPGAPMYFWGTMFTPGQTWWEPARAWVNYISRCQYILTKGKNVADVVGLMPTLNWIDAMPSGLHKNYNYDLLSEEIFLKNMDWKDGYFRLPSGVKYRVLFLPKTNGKMAPEIIAKLTELVKKGGTVVCQDKPQTASGLQGYPQTDVKVKRLAAALWGKCNGTTIKENKVGNGRLIWMKEVWKDEMDIENDYFIKTRTKDKTFYGKPESTTRWSPEFVKLLKSITPPDVEVLKAGGKAMAWGGKEETAVGTREKEDAIAWVHHTEGNTDTYFVSSQVATDNEAEILFRIKNKVPEIWNAETGTLYRPEKWQQIGNRIKITIPFHSFGSVFIMFKPAAVIQRNLPVYHLVKQTKQVIPVNDTWTVSFPKGFGAPESAEVKTGSLTDNPTLGVKYFSGTATYKQDINISAKQLQGDIELDLGLVRNLAEIIVNGQSTGVIWAPPFKASIGHLLKPGTNKIEVKVTDTWWNRMVGDEQLPSDLTWGANVLYAGNDYKGYPLKEIPKWVWNGGQRPVKDRVTFSTWRFVDKNSPLQQAGLIGPVQLEVKEK